MKQRHVTDGDAALYSGACPACREGRVHTDAEWLNHPLSGHGFSKEHGFTHDALKPKEPEPQP